VKEKLKTGRIAFFIVARTSITSNVKFVGNLQEWKLALVSTQKKPSMPSSVWWYLSFFNFCRYFSVRSWDRILIKTLIWPITLFKLIILIVKPKKAKCCLNLDGIDSFFLSTLAPVSNLMINRYSFLRWARTHTWFSSAKEKHPKSTYCPKNSWLLIFLWCFVGLLYQTGRGNKL